MADSLDSGSSAHYGRAGSSPASRTIEKSLNALCFQGFFLFIDLVLALWLALFLRQTLDEPLHTVSAIAFHLFCYMTIDIQRKSCGMMTKIFLQSFYVVTTLQRSNGIRVPLRYNYDKPEKPRISRVFGYLARSFILFQTEKSSREVVIS